MLGYILRRIGLMIPTLFGIMQNALLQDNALTPGTTDRVSVYTRILRIDLATGDTEEYVYPLVAANRGQGVSEILAINDGELLVLERGEPPVAGIRHVVGIEDRPGRHERDAEEGVLRHRQEQVEQANRMWQPPW